MSISKILRNPVANLSINTALVYGVAYAGRSYLNINPVHAALFALTTFIANHLGKELGKIFTHESYYNATPKARTISAIASYYPAITVLSSKIFSPLQTLAVIGLTEVCSTIYSRCTDIFTNNISSPWNLDFQKKSK